MTDKTEAPDLRERVARAVFDASTFYGEWDNQPQLNREVCEQMADAAIAEIGAEPSAISAESGWTIDPNLLIEVTHDINREGWEANLEVVELAMLAAERALAGKEGA